MMKLIKKNKKGFTLVELIVVIAILGILAALIVPRVGEFREQANISHDRATLRTVQGAVNMYHAQNGTWPDATDYAGLYVQLEDFLTLTGGEMPKALSALGDFDYNPETGLVTQEPPPPPPPAE